MQEKVLSSKKNGMAMMILFILLYAAATALAIIGSIFYYIPMAAGGFIWLSLGWIPFLGLKVLKPQEALVLTLFGNVGTLKDDGFYWLNPFCTAVNPAAKTKLNQSGDVDGGNAAKSVLTLAAAGTGGSSNSSCVSKKISLKIMTLNNNRQKIINMMNEIQKMFLPLLQSRVLEHRYPDLTPLTERMTSLASELRIIEKQPVALWQHAVRVAARRQEAAYLRGCEQLLAKMCGELAALCNMDSNPAPGEKSIERLTAHGLTAPENLKDYCRCSPVDAQVMDFHIGNLLDAYDFLTAFHHV